MGDLLRSFACPTRSVASNIFVVKAFPPGPQRYHAGVPARDWGGGRCQSGVQGMAAMRGEAVTAFNYHKQTPKG